MNWISIEKYYPPKDHNWLIVRTINSDYTVFYFMALYSHERNKWNFFDDQYNEQGRMQVTHWTFPDDVIEGDFFEINDSRSES